MVGFAFQVRDRDDQHTISQMPKDDTKGKSGHSTTLMPLIDMGEPFGTVRNRLDCRLDRGEESRCYSLTSICIPNR